MALAKLTIDLDARLAGLEQGMRKATTVAERNAARIDRAFSGLKATAVSIGAALGGAFAVRELVQAADQYANLNARLKLVTTSTREFEVAQAALFAMSQNTRVGLEQTTDLFASLVRSTESLGVSQADVLGVTQSINQALVISGTSAQSAAAALVQLGQGFASGALRGEELNSVLEQAPRLAKAIADGLGVPIGKLREMGKAGELTAEQVFGALQKASADIKREFEQMPLTVGQATTQAQNALLKLIGVIDQTSGASSGLAKAISAASDAIGDMADAMDRNAKGGGFFASIWKEIQANFASDRLTTVVAEIESLQATIDRQGSDSYLLKKMAALRAEAAALSRDAMVASDALKGFAGDPLDDGSFDRLEDRRLAGRRPAAGGGGGGDKSKKRDPYADAVKSLREQIALMGQDTELAEVNARIKLGTYGALSAAQAQNLQNLAAQLDMRKAEQKADEAAKKAAEDRLALEQRIRESTSQLAAQSIASSMEEVEGLMRGNEALREEVETLIGGEKARRAIEQARISSTIALKEEALAMLQNSGASEAEIQALQQQIALLKERAGLMGEKGAAQDAKEAADEAGEFSKQAARNIQDSLGTTLKNTLRGDFKSIGDLWLNTLQDMAAQAAAAKLNKYLFGADFAKTGDIGGALGGIFKSFGGLFADGGSLGAGKWGIAGEAGPEIIRGPAQIVPMTGRGARGGVSVAFNPTIYIDSRSDQATVAGLVTGALEQNNRALMEQLRAQGALA